MPTQHEPLPPAPVVNSLLEADLDEQDPYADGDDSLLTYLPPPTWRERLRARLTRLERE